MPVTKKFNRPDAFGPDCVFAITDWKGFIGAAALEQATITGTLDEVATPYGTGIRVGVANSYVTFNWQGIAPLTTNPKSIFVRVYFPSTAAFYKPIAWGNDGVADNAFMVYCSPTGEYGGGYTSDADQAGAIGAPSWVTMGVSNTGVIGGANIVYGQGNQVVAGTNAGNAVTSYSSLYILRGPAGGPGYQCPVGTVVQEAIVFRRVVSAAEFLDLHNACIGNKL